MSGVELIGLISSIASVLEISAQLLCAGYQFLSGIKGAPKQLRLILHEVSALDTVLSRLQEATSEKSVDHWSSALRDFAASAGKGYVLQDCHTCLDDVKKILDKCMRESRVQVVGRVRWLLEERDVTTTMERLARLRGIVMDAVTLDLAAGIERLQVDGRRIQETVSEIQESQRRADLLKWIMPEDNPLEEMHNAAGKHRYGATGTWLLTSDDFQTWMNTSNETFWISGLPGSGKTTLAATVIDYLSTSIGGVSDPHPVSVVTFFYCDHRTTAKQTVYNLLCTLTWQLAMKAPNSASCMQALLDKKKGDGRAKPSMHEYAELFKALSRECHRVYVVLDALDEAAHIQSFCRILLEISNVNAHSPISVLITSRPILEIERELSPKAQHAISLNHAVQDDINAYIDWRVKDELMNSKPNPLSEELVDFVIARIRDTSNGLFLQAKLSLDIVCEAVSIKAIRSALNNLPNGLESTYERIILRILSQYPREAPQLKIMLYWLICSYEHLTTDMLTEVSAIEVGDTSLDLEAVPMDPESFVGKLSSLVAFDRRHSPPLVKLSHVSVEEYLRSSAILRSSAARFHIDESLGHRLLAGTCMQYLCFRNFPKEQLTHDLINSFHDEVKPFIGVMKMGRFYRKVSRRKYAFTHGRPPLLDRFPLLGYAAEYWPQHLRDAKCSPAEFEEFMRPGLHWFLCPSSSELSPFMLWNTIHMSTCYDLDDCELGQSPFFYAIKYDLLECFEVLRPQHNINQRFPGGWTPLTLAALCGSTRVHRGLLEGGAQPDMHASGTAHNRLTALHLAAEGCHANMVDMLMSHGASVMSRTTTGTTPLYRAVRGGSVAIVRKLLEAKSDVNAKTWDRWTPLFEAAVLSDNSMLKILLDYGADTSITTLDGDCAADLVEWLNGYKLLLA